MWKLFDPKRMIGGLKRSYRLTCAGCADVGLGVASGPWQRSEKQRRQCCYRDEAEQAPRNFRMTL